ncbi:MAG TPA: ribonuclease E/G [Caulobacteraceae bacterium]|jgi:Ribonuclease G/E|nr:ribonuclease E/G [Caulobacteraceae bacterium]
MNRRRLFLDKAPGESRGVVTLDGRPERLLIRRIDDLPGQLPGARSVARVRRIERGQGGAFLDLGEGPEALLPLTGAAKGLNEGAAVEVEIITQARRGKGAVARFVAHAEGSPRLAAPAPGLTEQLIRFAPDQAVGWGAEAREAADIAEEAALAIEHPLPGGGVISIEPTRALTAIDIDLGATGGDSARAVRRINSSAIDEAARLLRLKSIGGLVVFDLIGERHDGAALAAAAKAAFAPDQPGVSIGPVSRLGLLQLALPRRARPIGEFLTEADGRAAPAAIALRLLRALEREGRADGGARLVGHCAPAAAAAARTYIDELIGRIGPRFEIRADPGFLSDRFEVSAL